MCPQVLFNHYIITIVLLRKFIIKILKTCEILQMMLTRKDLFVLIIKMKYKIVEESSLL